MWPREIENRNNFIEVMVFVSKNVCLLKCIRLDPEVKFVS